MGDLFDFQRGQIVGARIAGATIIETAQLLEISRGTVSKVMATYEKEGKTSSAKHKLGRSSSLSERDRRTLNCIVRKDHKTTASKITAELNEHRERPVSTKTFRRELHKSGFYRKAAMKKPFLTQTKVTKCLEWCKRLKDWSLK